MTSPVQTLREGASLEDAHRVLRESSLSALAVVDGHGAPVGVISRTDLLRIGRVSERRSGRYPLLELPKQAVREVMTREVVSVTPDQSVQEAAQRMVHHKIHRVLVLEGSALAGVLSTKDLMTAVQDHKVRAPISDFMSAPVLTVDVTDTLATASDRLNDAHIAGLVVLEDERPVGVFTQTEALQSREDAATVVVEDRMNYAMLCLDLKTPLHRAAALARATSARRIIACEGRKIWGVVTGMDIARAASL